MNPLALDHYHVIPHRDGDDGDVGGATGGIGGFNGWT